MSKSNTGAKHRSVYAAGAVTAALLGTYAVVYAQNTKAVATAPATLPSVPAIPASADFLAQAAGRAAVADAMYSLYSAPKLSFSAKWQTLVQDERKRVSGRTGSETLIRDASANRVSLVSVLDAVGNAPSVTQRFVSDGRMLIGARYAPLAANAKPQPNAAPVRSFFQIPLQGEVETATDALILAKANESPLTRAARVVLLSPLENGGYGWRGRGTFYKAADGTVLENLPVDGNDRRTVTTVRRYHMDPATRRPNQIEEWLTVANTDRSTSRTTYRSERYTYTAYPTRTDIYSTKPAPNYAETSPPSAAKLPDLPGPDDADAQSRALLARWQRAWARLTAYNATITIGSKTMSQTVESRPIAPDDASQEGNMTLYFRRPGRLYIVSQPNPAAVKDNRGMGRRPNAIAGPQTAISDGTTLSVYDGLLKEKKRGDAPINGEDNVLRQGLRRNGFDDRADVLTWLLDGPQNVFGSAELAEYRGTLPLPDGGAAEAVTLRQFLSQNGMRRRQRGMQRGGGGTVQTTIYTTIYFDKANGLPLRIERFIDTNNTIVGRRDSPPHRYFGVDYQNVRLNEETPGGMFKR